MSGIPEGAEPMGGGFYSHGGELHVDLDEFIRAGGGDPARKADVDKALEIIESVSGKQGLPVEVRE